MFDYEIFKNVNAREFLQQGWQKADKEIRSPHITEMINRFNEVSYWVTTEVLRVDKKLQTRVIKKFVHVADRCLQLNNFNSVMVILSGLNNSAVQRLKDAWEVRRGFF